MAPLHRRIVRNQVCDGPSQLRPSLAHGAIVLGYAGKERHVDHLEFYHHCTGAFSLDHVPHAQLKRKASMSPELRRAWMRPALFSRSLETTRSLARVGGKR